MLTPKTDLRGYLVIARTQLHRRKVSQAMAEIDRSMRQHDRFIVCSSWGKDSCALVSLVLTVCGPGFDVAHLQSPYELPGNESTLEWFGARCAIHTLPTERTLGDYISWLQTHGLHYERERQCNLGKTSKRDELVEWVRKHGYSLQILGMRAQESKGRRSCFRARGLTYQAHGLTVCNPIGWWSNKDVWAYLVSREIPWHPLYDCETHGETRETLRNGGWLSVHGCNDARGPWLRAHFPDEWRRLIDAFPRMRIHS
jgi:phosphoadenosine phosphosulfate reductase